MQPEEHFRLTVRQGLTPGKVFELARDVMTIGRDLKCEVVVNDPEISRNHCRLTVQGNGYQVEDLESTNGTFVNSQKVTAPKLLQPGDLLGLGENLVMEYGLSDTAAATIVMQPGAHGHTPPPPPPPPPPPIEVPVSPAAPTYPLESYSPPPAALPPDISAGSPPPMSEPYAPPAAQPWMEAPAPDIVPPKKNNRNMIIAIVVVVVLLCCCCPTLIGIGIAVAQSQGIKMPWDANITLPLLSMLSSLLA